METQKILNRQSSLEKEKKSYLMDKCLLMSMIWN